MLNIKQNIQKDTFFKVILGQSGEEMIEDLSRKSLLRKMLKKDD